MVSKTKSLKLHAKRRAKDRYDLDMSQHEHRQIIQKIRRGEVLTNKRISNRVIEKTLVFQGKTIKVLYDNSRRTIITFLPLEARTK